MIWLYLPGVRPEVDNKRNLMVFPDTFSLNIGSRPVIKEVKMFKDRADAGKKLAEELKNLDIAADKVLAIPMGGIPVAFEVARELGLPLDFVVVRKLPLPDNPESGLGAISEDGSLIFNKLAEFYSKEVIENITKKQENEIEKRIRLLKRERKLDLTGKSVIIVDDGLATGSTMEAAVKTCENLGARIIVIAVPTASQAVIKRFEKLVERIVCLDIRKNFVAVADAYEEWHDVGEKEALDLLASLKR
jgi:putative phosphoribosyl transferase